MSERRFTEKHAMPSADAVMAVRHPAVRHGQGQLRAWACHGCHALAIGLRAQGADGLSRLLRIALASKRVPIDALLVRGLDMLLSDQAFADVAAMPDEMIIAGIADIPDVDAGVSALAVKISASKAHAAAVLIATSVRSVAAQEVAAA